MPSSTHKKEMEDMQAAHAAQLQQMQQQMQMQMQQQQMQMFMMMRGMGQMGMPGMGQAGMGGMEQMPMGMPGMGQTPTGMPGMGQTGMGGIEQMGIGGMGQMGMGGTGPMGMGGMGPMGMGGMGQMGMGGMGQMGMGMGQMGMGGTGQMGTGGMGQTGTMGQAPAGTPTEQTVSGHPRSSSATSACGSRGSERATTAGSSSAGSSQSTIHGNTAQKDALKALQKRRDSASESTVTHRSAASTLRGSRKALERDVEEGQSQMVGASCYSNHAGKTRGPEAAERDRFGNCTGQQYDLALDSAFEGETIAVMQLYTGEGFSMASPAAALERKGFKLLHWKALPPLAEFKAGLQRACQLWVISGASTSVTGEHVEVIKKFVQDDKKGLFLWGDNDPYNADANRILAALPATSGLTLTGNYYGDKVLEEAPSAEKAGQGFRQHLVCTGLESMYEGITIAAVRGPAEQRTALIKSSDGEVVTASHEHNRTRILIDGGFTRLMEDRWARTAGTARFVTNAAAWLYNSEGRGVLPRKAQQEADAASASFQAKLSAKVAAADAALSSMSSSSRGRSASRSSSQSSSRSRSRSSSSSRSSSKSNSSSRSSGSGSASSIVIGSRGGAGFAGSDSDDDGPGI
jgi:hypothetical protein